MLLRELSQQNLIGLLKGLHELTEDSLRNQLYTDVSILSSAIAALNDETNMIPLKADKIPTAFSRGEDPFGYVVLPTTPKEPEPEARLATPEEAEALVVKTTAEADKYRDSIQTPTATVGDITDSMFQELIIDSIKAIKVRYGCEVATSFQLLDELKANLDTLYPGYTELRSPSTRGKLHWMVMFSKHSLKLIRGGWITKQGARYYGLPTIAAAEETVVEEPKPEESSKSKLEIVELRPKAMIPVKANSPTNSIHKTSQLFNKPKVR